MVIVIFSSQPSLAPQFKFCAQSVSFDRKVEKEKTFIKTQKERNIHKKIYDLLGHNIWFSATFAILRHLKCKNWQQWRTKSIFFPFCLSFFLFDFAGICFYFLFVLIAGQNHNSIDFALAFFSGNGWTNVFFYLLDYNEYVCIINSANRTWFECLFDAWNGRKI